MYEKGDKEMALPRLLDSLSKAYIPDVMVMSDNTTQFAVPAHIIEPCEDHEEMRVIKLDKFAEDQFLSDENVNYINEQ